MTQNTAVAEDNDTFGTPRGRNGKVLDKYAQRRIRNGKTRKDHQSGAHRQRFTNQEERGAWINETRGKHYGSESVVPKFPKAHGLGNSSKRFKLKAGRVSKG